jgi:hypothetical protein
MSAEIINLRAWRRAHRETERMQVNVPVLVPTWPWGWLAPVLIEIRFEQ